MVYICESISETWLITQFFYELFCFGVNDFASQRQIAISCLPDVTQESSLHSGKFECSILLHFLVACSLTDSENFLTIEITDFEFLIHHTPHSSIIFIFASKLNNFLFPILIFKKCMPVSQKIKGYTCFFHVKGPLHYRACLL
jgi:hypothetical protein